MEFFEPVILRNQVVPNIRDIDVYIADGGYEGLRAALQMQPAAVIETVKKSGLRGRGGAGFPTGMKWGFLPPDSPKPRYLCVNADESEPGTCHDHELIEQNPHQAIEGIIITAYATKAVRAFIYIRGEFYRGALILEQAIAEARQRGFLGENILGSGYSLDIVVHRGAGAYICGEETALLSSLEGYKGFPRNKPPFPAVAGLYASPTVINNIGTLAHVPPILRHGAEWFAQWTSARTTGPLVVSVSGHVVRPGNYEVPIGITMRDLIYDVAGGIRDGNRLKAIVPGGSSAAMIGPDKLDTPVEFDALAAAGTMLGSAGVIVLDETTCIVAATLRMAEFYKEESCGKCTPCREGTGWMVDILRRLEAGTGRMQDVTLLTSVANNIAGKSFCLLGDASAAPVVSSVKLFREEYEAHVRAQGCPLRSDWIRAGLNMMPDRVLART